MLPLLSCGKVGRLGISELTLIVNVPPPGHSTSTVGSSDVSESESGGDGTPAPTAVNTGDELSSSSNSMVLFAAAAGLFALAGGAVALRRRTVES